MGVLVLIKSLRKSLPKYRAYGSKKVYLSAKIMLKVNFQRLFAIGYNLELAYPINWVESIHQTFIKHLSNIH